MNSKMFEIRDRGTTITAIAIKTDGNNYQEFSHFKRGGWGSNSIILMKTNGESICSHDPFFWRNDGSRTMFEAHRFIEQNYDQLVNFEVIDIEYLLGETSKKKESEIL